MVTRPGPVGTCAMISPGSLFDRATFRQEPIMLLRAVVSFGRRQSHSGASRSHDQGDCYRQLTTEADDQTGHPKLLCAFTPRIERHNLQHPVPQEPERRPRGIATWSMGRGLQGPRDRAGSESHRKTPQDHTVQCKDARCDRRTQERDRNPGKK